MTQALVFDTVAGATLTWAAAEYWRLFVRSGSDSVPRTLWTLGAVLMVVHSAAAFGVFHGWSHAAAMVATARQTETMTGLPWGGGLFVNYAFLTVWIADVAWWWVSPRSFRARPGIINSALRAFFLFMFLNGAVIFADGLMRALGMVAVAVVLIAWYRS